MKKRKNKTTKYRHYIALLKGRMRHSVKRAQVRYGLLMDEYDYFYLINQIDSMESEWVKELYGRRELWRVRLKGKHMYAVYEPATKMICSFLTREMA